MARSVHFIAHHDRENAVSRYRCLNFIDQLGSLGWTAKFSYRYGPGPIVIDEDVVVLNRALLDDPIRDLIERLKTAGKAVVFGVDDLIFSGDWADKERAEAEPGVAERAWRETMGFVEQSKGTMMLCDCALVSTQYLAERSEGLGKEAFLLRNTLPGELWSLSEKPVKAEYLKTLRDQQNPSSLLEEWSLRNEKLSETKFRDVGTGEGLRDTNDEPQASEGLGDRPKEEWTASKVLLGYFSGTRTHNLDFDSIAAPLARVMEKHAQVELMIVGPVKTPAALLPYERRIHRRETVEWRKLPALLAEVDINLAPLDLSFAFNHGKSHLKWLESAAVGVPTAASRTAELSSSIDEGVDGFTAVTAEDWFEALERLAEDGGVRKKMGRIAFEKVGRQYLSSAQALQTADVFEAIAGKFSSGVLESVSFAGHEEPGFLTKGIRKVMRALNGG